MQTFLAIRLKLFVSYIDVIQHQTWLRSFKVFGKLGFKLETRITWKVYTKGPL